MGIWGESAHVGRSLPALRPKAGRVYPPHANTNPQTHTFRSEAKRARYAKAFVQVSTVVAREPRRRHHTGQVLNVFLV